MRLMDNTVLITGGASGIGLAFAEMFLELGNRVILCGRSPNKLEAVKSRLPAVTVLPCDLTDTRSREGLAKIIKQKFSDLNILVNNAGIQHNYRFDDGEDHGAKIDEEIAANFTSHMRLTDALLPLLLSKPEAALVNISSALSRVPKESAPVYCATKAGIHIFSKALRYQLEKSSVKVFEIVPALVDTAMTAGRGRDKMSPKAVAQEAIHGLRRDRYYIRVGKTKLLFGIQRLIPPLADRIIRKG